MLAMWVSLPRREIEERSYIPHVRPRGEEIAEKTKTLISRARRWVVVEFVIRGLTGSESSCGYEKMDRSYLRLTYYAWPLLLSVFT